MEKVSFDVLRELKEAEGQPSVSIYMPTIKASAETRQNPIRFKNLLTKIRNSLSEDDQTSLKDVLKWCTALCDDYEFWQHQDLGLAVFANPDRQVFYHLPREVPEVAVFSDRCVLTPLISFIARNQNFFLLRLDLEETILYEGSGYGLERMSVEGFPTSIEEVLQYRVADKQFQHHAAKVSSGAGESSALFHAHDPSEQQKVVIQEYLRLVDARVCEILKGRNEPLVLAGVKYVLAFYKDLTRYSNLAEQHFIGSTAKLSEHELNQEGLNIAQSLSTDTNSSVVARFKERHGTGLTSVGFDNVIADAQQGRVDVLLLRDEETTTANSDTSLINAAAIEALNTNADIVFVPSEVFPVEGSVAALLRY